MKDRSNLDHGGALSLPNRKWVPVSQFEDVDYTVEGTTAVITINRPQRYNAFRARTVDELIKAFRLAWADRQVQAVILTGAGEKAFCTGATSSSAPRRATTARVRAACSRLATCTS